MEEYREDYIPMSDLGEDVSVSSDDDQTDLAREIHGHLRFLKAALPAVNNSGLTVSSTQMEGWLWTQKNESRWKKRWFVWRYSDAHEQWVLYAYKSQESNRGPVGTVQSKVKSMLRTQNDDPQAKTMSKMTFAHREEFSKEQQESYLEAMQKEDVPTSKTLIRLISRKSVVVLAAANDDEVARWDRVLTLYLRDLLGTRYDECLVVAEKLAGLIQQQYAEYLRKCRELMRALERNGFFEDKFNQKKDKSGTLWVESSNALDCWRKHRFILQGKMLYHYPSEKGHNSKRAIPLKFVTIECDPEPHPDGFCIFQISTPLISYVIKAQHKVAMEEWINAIERNKNKPKLTPSEKISEGVKGMAAALAHFQLGSKTEELFPDASPLLPEGEGDEGNPAEEGISAKRAMLVISAPDSRKEKTVHIKKTSYKIGRSSSNDIVIDDSRLSREHASIGVVGDKLVFYDLGSKRGSKVNKVKVTDRVVLHAGDTIKVGKTFIQVLRTDPAGWLPYPALQHNNGTEPRIALSHHQPNKFLHGPGGGGFRWFSRVGDLNS